jgi:uncharacterized protein
MIDRLGVRERPPGTPVMHQTWSKLLFLHWRLDPALLRPHIPAGLEIDTCDGSAWIALTPFTITGIRPPYLPAVPVISASHELNVRTYVHRDGVPGVWFFSLDASNALAVPAARLSFHLPYFRARMELHEENGTIHFASTRSEGSEPFPGFEARWIRTTPLTPPDPSSLDFFLIERYCLFSASDRHLHRARIHHRPWPLRRAELLSIESSMLARQGLPGVTGDPLLHAQGEPLHVEIWPPEEVGRR